MFRFFLDATIQTYINWYKVAEETIPLLLTGVGVLIFFWVKSHYERKSREKSVWFSMYEDKKLQTIIEFINQFNLILTKLEEGVYIANKEALSNDRVKKFGAEILAMFNNFYNSYSALSFYLTLEEFKLFREVYDETQVYYKAITETIHYRAGAANNVSVDIDSIRDHVHTVSKNKVAQIGEYFRKFVK